MREYQIECSQQTVLVCASCSERVVILGKIEDWYKEERFEFTCSCGKHLSFADALPDQLDTLKT